MKKNPLLEKLRASAAIADARTIRNIPTQELTLVLDLENMEIEGKKLATTVRIWGDTLDDGQAFITLCVTSFHSSVMVDLLPTEARELATILSALSRKIEELSRGEKNAPAPL